MSKIYDFPHLPERIRGLGNLAYNLWWNWNPAARDLYRNLDLQAWRESEHNPEEMLTLLHQDVLNNASQDQNYLMRYDAETDQFEEKTASQAGWFDAEYRRVDSPLAYFSTEYGLHTSLPVYAGLDGWWIEAYNGENGWTYGFEAIQGERAQADSEAIYHFLENEIIPLYYRRSDKDVPEGFVKVMKTFIKSVAPNFCANGWSRNMSNSSMKKPLVWIEWW
jgi:glucan phosphorylase